jgi:hypothetical protein
MSLLDELKAGTLITENTYNFVLNTQEHTTANRQVFRYEPGEPFDAKILRYTIAKKVGTNEPFGVVLELTQEYPKNPYNPEGINPTTRGKFLSLSVPIERIESVEEIAPEGQMSILKGGQKRNRKFKNTICKNKKKNKRSKRKNIYSRRKSRRSRSKKRKYY